MVPKQAASIQIVVEMCMMSASRTFECDRGKMGARKSPADLGQPAKQGTKLVNSEGKINKNIGGQRSDSLQRQLNGCSGGKTM
jgi:hypothetical protein